MGGGDSISDHLIPEFEEAEEISSSTVSSSSSSSSEMILHHDTDDGYHDGSEQAAARMRRRRTHLDLLNKYEDSRVSPESLLMAKKALERHRPGDWMEELGGAKFADYAVPEVTTLLLVGPRGSGKSSLVNRITRVLSGDPSAPDRAQVSYNLLATDGSCFLQEYMMPKNPSLRVYDSRSLSSKPSENFKLLQRWMTSGVTHGEVIIRDSDADVTIKRMKAMLRQELFRPCQKRTINFVIFVVDGVSVLKSMDKKERLYTDMVVETFNYPFLSFKDCKPAIVVTHGDELSFNDRARVRTHLGELLGIPPNRQIFDIPDTNGSLTEMAIMDMLRYSICQADRNLPFKQSYLLEGQKMLVRTMDKFQAFDMWILTLEVLISCLCIFVLFLHCYEKLVK